MSLMMSEPRSHEDDALERYEEDELTSYAGRPKINWVKTLIIVISTLVTVVVMSGGACFIMIKNVMH